MDYDSLVKATRRISHTPLHHDAVLKAQGSLESDRRIGERPREGARYDGIYHYKCHVLCH